MITKINKTADFKEKMRAERKVSLLNTPKDIQAIFAMNKQMEEVRREYQVKDRNSQTKASLVILTA